MNWTEVKIWALLAGLGLFLFGMFIMEESLRKLVGRSFKKFLRKQTGNSIKAVLSGTLVTAILQSSSMLTLLVMSFTSAGIIGLKSGIGMILGANLGTTFTGWMVSLIGFKLNIGEFILPFLAIGGLGTIFLKTEKLSYLSKFLMGFSFMFLGLEYMKTGFADFVEHVDLTFLHDKPLIVFLPIGFALAATIQSSSASMMIFLSSLSSGIITLHQAAFLVIGADLGTTMTGIIGTINGNSIKRKTGWAQFYINVISSSIALILFKIFFYFIQDVFNVEDSLIALVFFHSLFNAVGIIVITPFLNVFTRLVDNYISQANDTLTSWITHVNPAESDASIEALEKETRKFLHQAIETNKQMFTLKTEDDSKRYLYSSLKDYENEIAAFYIKLQQNNLIEKEAEQINYLVAAVRNASLSAKDIKDIKHNIEELNNSGSDEKHQYFKLIKSEQKKFYTAVAIPQDSNNFLSPEDVENLKQLNRNSHLSESEQILELYKHHSDSNINLSSLMNMAREINNSNESLCRSIDYLNHFYQSQKKQQS